MMTHLHNKRLVRFIRLHLPVLSDLITLHYDTFAFTLAGESLSSLKDEIKCHISVQLHAHPEHYSSYHQRGQQLIQLNR